MTAKDRAIDSLSDALWDTEMVSARLLLGISEFCWGLLLMWPGSLFARPTYKVMATVMPEQAWALVFLLSSVTQITIIIRKDFHCWLARYFAAWNMVMWVFVVSAAYLSVYPPPAAMSGEVALALASVWIWIRPFLLLEAYERAERTTAHL